MTAALRGTRRAALWLAAGSLLLTGCEFNGLQDVTLPGGAASDGNAYHVTVEFRDVLDLVPQSTVKVNNVTVGAVEKVRLDGWHARVRLRIDDEVKLPANAIAELRQTSMLGEKYVSLSPPTDVEPSGRLKDGARIPLSRSNRNPEIEEVLSALSALLNGGGVAQLHTITKELNNALEGREDRVGDLLDELDTFLGGLDEQRSEIVRAMKGIDKLAKTLSKQRTTVEKAVDTMPSALKILADQRRGLTKMLKALGKLGKVGSDVIEASRDDTVANLKSLQPVLTRLNEAGDDLPNALDLLTTYPFPRNVVDAIEGDYVNLKITADLDARSLYGNLTGGPDDPDKPGGPDSGLPDVPGLPKPPGLPDLPGLPDATPTSLPCVPGLTCPDDGEDSPDQSPDPPPGGNDALCPPLCTGSRASYSDGGSGPSGLLEGGFLDSGLPEGVDPVLVRLLLRGMQP